MASDEKELKKCRFLTLEVGSGKWSKDGKVYWPHYVSVSMSRAQALELGTRLLRFAVEDGLCPEKIAWDESYYLPLVGELRESEE